MLNLAIADPVIDSAAKFFSDPKVEKKILGILAQFGLDRKAIEAEAFRLVASEVEKYDRLLSGAERQRHKVLKELAHYRQDLSVLFRQVTDRIIARADQQPAEKSVASADGD